MIKYIVVPDKKQTVAILKNTEFDALNKIRKMTRDYNVCVTDAHHYLMPRQFKVVVTCNPLDVYSEEEGKRRAKEKLMRKYYRQLDKRMMMFSKTIANLNKNISKSCEIKA